MNWESAGCAQDGAATIQGIKCIILPLLGFVPGLIVIAAIFMIIISGAQMIMGGDNPKELATAQQTLLFAVLGLVGIGLSWVILRLIEAFTGAPVTILNFSI